MKKKVLTKSIALLLSFALLIMALSGCSLETGNRPFEQTIKRYINTLSAGNYDLLKHITTEDSVIRTKITYAPEKEQENFKLLFNQISLQGITDASQNNYEIIAHINIIHIDYTTIIEGLRNSLAEKIKSSLPKKDFKQETLNKDLLQLLVKHYDEQKWPDTSAEQITIHLQKINGTWLISDDKELYDTLSGRFNESFNNSVGRMTTKILEQLKAKIDPNEIETGGENIFDDPDNVYFQVDNDAYWLPCEANQLQKFVFSQYDLKRTVKTSGRLYIRSGNENVGSLDIYNTVGAPIYPLDCMVTTIRMDTKINSVNVTLPGGITFGSSAADILELYGPPSKVNTSVSSDYFSLIYNSSKAYIVLYFYDGIALSGFEISV